MQPSSQPNVFLNEWLGRNTSAPTHSSPAVKEVSDACKKVAQQMTDVQKEMTKVYWKIKKRKHCPDAAQQKLEAVRERVNNGLKYLQGFARGKFTIDALDVEFGLQNFYTLNT